MFYKQFPDCFSFTYDRQCKLTTILNVPIYRAIDFDTKELDFRNLYGGNQNFSDKTIQPVFYLFSSGSNHRLSSMLLLLLMDSYKR